MPKVSICIAVYNVEKYIEQCVRSLFEQTLDDLEYIFVDDASPDASIDVMLRVLEDYPHRKTGKVINIIVNPANPSNSAAMIYYSSYFAKYNIICIDKYI